MNEVCEICGDLAFNLVTTLVEQEPEADSEGRLWATWEIAERHYTCNRHKHEFQVKLIRRKDQQHEC